MCNVVKFHFARPVALWMFYIEKFSKRYRLKH